MYSICRWHEIDVGHRVVGQGSKCENIHGHRYRIEFYARSSSLNEIGMVIDFSVIKDLMCKWLDDNWDHKYLAFVEDPFFPILAELPGVYPVDFNPTAENIAAFLLYNVAPTLMEDTCVDIWKVVVHETLKCSAEVNDE